MSERGFIAVDRGLWDNTTFANEAFSEREAWLWLIAEAAWQDKAIRIGATVIKLARGQLCHSTRFMASKWQWSEASVRRFLRKLEKAEQVTFKSDAGTTQLTVCNYDIYQSAPKESDATKTRGRRKEEQDNKPSNEGISNQDERVTALCQVLDEEHAVAIHEHRLIKAPKDWTVRSAKMMAKELARAPEIGMTPNDASEAVIRNSWTGFNLEWLAKGRTQSPRLIHSSHGPPLGPHRKPLRQNERMQQKLLHVGQSHDDRQQDRFDIEAEYRRQYGPG